MGAVFSDEVRNTKRVTSFSDEGRNVFFMERRSSPRGATSNAFPKSYSFIGFFIGFIDFCPKPEEARGGRAFCSGVLFGEFFLSPEKPNVISSVFQKIWPTINNVI